MPPDVAISCRVYEKSKRRLPRRVIYCVIATGNHFSEIATLCSSQ